MIIYPIITFKLYNIQNNSQCTTIKNPIIPLAIIKKVYLDIIIPLAIIAIISHYPISHHSHWQYDHHTIQVPIKMVFHHGNHSIQVPILIPSCPYFDRPSLQDPQAPDRGYASYFKVDGLLAGDDWLVLKPMVFRMILPQKNNLYHVFLSLVIGFSVHQS